MKKTMQKMLLTFLLSCMAMLSHAQQRTVTGTVMDEQGAALPNVSYIVKSTSAGGVTNEDGAFAATISSNADAIEFSSVGYATQTITVGSNTTLNVIMKKSGEELEGVVVTAMGIKREQRKLGYATTTLNNQDIIKSSPTNFASALYGKAPGVSINTSAGGGNAAVTIDIRGNMNSIGFQKQPLIVVDGVITRNEAVNNGGFWDDQRIRGNGILDINPENIESINILKGAAASALYGSDAASGVVVITTKSGKGAKGLGVEVNASYGIEKVGVLPDYQFEFGPGYARTINQSNFGANDEGFIERQVSNGRIWFGTPNVSTTFNIPAPAGYNNGDVVRQPILSGWGQFGPRFDGQDAIYWDGEIRPFVAYEDNYKKFYRNGHSGIYSAAIFNSGEKFNYRFSYTRNDYRSIMESGPQSKNTFNLNANFKITSKLDVSVIANYVTEHINNRPYMIDRMTNNYTGFLSPAQNIEWFMDKYQTSKGYKYVTSGNRSRDPEEAFIFGTAGVDYLDYYWTQRKRQYDEYTNRIIASTTINYQILKDLSVRGRLGTDYTGYQSENKEPNEFPLSVGTSGYYSTAMNKYNFLYGDLLMSYTKKITENFGVSLQAGYQGREESYIRTSQNTDGGLSQRDWFSLSASNNVTRGYSSRQKLLKDGLFGILSLDINNYLFIEGSLRQERTSTLYPGNNVFYYPSASAAFELSNAVNLPNFFTYSKIRTSYGIVGNPPSMYVANIVYEAQSASGTPTLVLPDRYGNNALKNETKKEFEIGWENRFLKSRAGIDITYYNNHIIDMIVDLDVASSTGVSKILQNVGNMRNYGLELGLSGTPVQTSNFTWNTRINFAFNRNTLTKLTSTLPMLQHSNIDNGSLYVRSFPGEAAGNIYTYTLTTHSNGELLVDESGYYVPDYNNLHKVGNIQPKTVGGFVNSFTYKDFSLNTVLDFRFGGQVYSPSIQYGRSAGMYKETLFGRDEATGGVAYYVADDGSFVSASGTVPSGKTVYHDGMILKGVDANGNPNTRIIESKEYYRLSYYWGQYPGSNRPGTYETAVFDNDFIRMREISLSYTLPRSIAQKIRAGNLVISAHGRNLFFFHKTLPHLDPEATVGTDWITKANIGNAGIVPRSFGLSIRALF
ncbi:MAG: SusC/RagA family TonB-linked outer membrane protein [Niabella sp.]